MEVIASLRDEDIFPNSQPSRFRPAEIRSAARAVVFDGQGRVGLLHVSKENYYKLPGGGVEEGEDVREALAREVDEELGVTIEVTGEVGEISEYRKEQAFEQHSKCYVAKVIGDTKAPNFTDSEIARGFEMFWAKDIDEALSKIDGCKPTTYEGKFIRKRDFILLETAKA